MPYNFPRPKNSHLQKVRALAQPRGKSTPGPETSGGWNVLMGSFNGNSFLNANEIWKDRSVQELEAIYKAQVIVYTCVQRIYTTLQQAPIKVQVKKNDAWDDDDQHWMNALLEQPNPSMTWSDFISHYVAHLELTGNTYGWKWRNGLRQVAEIWPVPTSWVTRRFDAAGRLTHYEVSQGSGRSISVPPKDMICDLYPNPTNLTDGLGPLQAAMRDVQTDDARGDYIIEMMENNHSPGTIVKQQYPWTPEEKDDVRAVLSQGLGKGNRGKTIFLSGDGAAIEQGVPLSDMDWPGISNLSETRICAAFGVPPIIAGLRAGLESATYSNFEQAVKVFTEGKIAPLWSKLDRTFTRALLRDEGETNRAVRIAHDTKDIKALQQDRDKGTDRGVKLFAGGLADLDEARAEAGLPPLANDEGKFRVLPMGLSPITGDDETPPKDDGNGNVEE